MAGGYGRDNLCHHGTCNLKASGAFDKLAVHNSAVIQHITDINQAAVKNRLDKIIGIVKMQHALFMGLRDFFWQHNALGQILRNLAGNQIALSCCHGGVFIGVLLHNILIAIANQGKNRFVSSVGLADQSTLVTVDDIGLSKLKFALIHQAVLHHILNIFYQEAHAITLLHMLGNFLDFILLDSIFGIYGCICLLNSDNYLATIKIYCGAIALNDLHLAPSFLKNFSITCQIFSKQLLPRG